MTLGAPTGVDVEALKAENEQLRSKCSDLEAKVELSLPAYIQCEKYAAFCFEPPK